MYLHHQGTITMETIRLVLRKFRLEDAKDMYQNWASDPEVCRFLLWGPHKDVQTSRRRIVQWLNQYDMDNSYVWAIELKRNKMTIGTISVEFSNESNRSCEIGYCIGRAYWNRGIMTEALRAVMHYLFYDIGYLCIRAKHDILNPASGKVMQKAGMHFVGYEYQVGTRRDGTYFDCAVYEKNITDE